MSSQVSPLPGFLEKSELKRQEICQIEIVKIITAF
jgi:hypothetical protein